MINRSMNKDTLQFEKIIKDQYKQIDSLKKAILALQNKVILLSQKTNRTYQNSRKNTNDINNIKGILNKNS